MRISGKSYNYRANEKGLQTKHSALFGDSKLRTGKPRFKFCQNCEFSNDEICIYDVCANKKDTKYPCGKAYAQWKESKKREETSW